MRLKEALEAVRADDLRLARSIAIELWTERRVPAVADLVDQIDRLLDETYDANTWDGSPAMIEAAERDPRVALSVYRFLTDHSGHVGQPKIEAFLEAAARSGDLRLHGLLKSQGRMALGHHVGNETSWLSLRIQQTLTRIKRQFPLGEPVLRERKTLEEIQVQLGLRAPEAPEHASLLLREIYEHPKDDDRRTVYADLLAGVGDRRGELIHLHLAGEDGAQLLELYEERWLGPLRPLVRNVDWARGFPSRATLIPAALADDHSGLAEWATIEELELPLFNVYSDVVLDRLVGLICAPTMRSLESLLYATMGLVTALAPHRPHLRHMSLGTPIDHEDLVDALSRFPNLVALELREHEPGMIIRLRAALPHIRISEV